MKRATKKGSRVYEYLESINVLDRDAAAIEEAKKRYWATVRKEWKRKQRQECKSYTIYLSKAECKRISQQAKRHTGGITQYIKEAALQNAAIIDRQAVGEIRMALALYYSSIETLIENKTVTKRVADILLKQFLITEKTILDLLLKRQ